MSRCPPLKPGDSPGNVWTGCIAKLEDCPGNERNSKRDKPMQHKSLMAALESLQATAQKHSESSNAIVCGIAKTLVTESGLPGDELRAVYHAIDSAANPSGYYYENNGIQAGITALEFLISQQEAA